jgi:hypothetical protein
MEMAVRDAVAHLRERLPGVTVDISCTERRALLPCVAVRCAGDGNAVFAQNEGIADRVLLEIVAVAERAGGRDELAGAVDAALREIGYIRLDAEDHPVTLGYSKVMRFERLFGADESRRERCGLFDVRLAPIIRNDTEEYICGAAVRIGDVVRIDIKPQVELAAVYADDGIERRISINNGATAEITLSQADFEAFAALGIGEYDPVRRLYSEHTQPRGVYSLRFATQTTGGYPLYTKYKVFNLICIRSEELSTRTSGATISMWIMQGFLELPATEGLPWRETILGDASNISACEAFMASDP